MGLGEQAVTFRERVLLGIIASCLALAMFAPTCDPVPVDSHTGIVLEGRE
jgi:hypothetical protein